MAEVNASFLGESNASLIYIPCGVFFVLSPLLVGTRLWSRMRNGGSLGADDYTIMASATFAIASSAIMIISCYYGYGRHRGVLTSPNLADTLKYFYICQITYKASINLTKSSILLLYVRIFGGIRWFKRVCIGLITIIALYCIASVLATIFQCSPVRKAWEKEMQGQCINNGQFWYANGGFSIATDMIILVLPMPLVYALHAPRVQKAALMLVFALGIFVVVTSCLRLTTINIQAISPDPTYDIASTMWTIIEMNVAIMCACLPQIRPLMLKMFPRLMPGSYSNERSERPPQVTYFNEHAKADPSSSEDSRWAHIEGRDGIHLSNLANVRKGDGSSEEYILQDDKTIHKTVNYSVEYSKKSSNDTLNSMV
ncbi:hypothetical protein JX266_009327 [Neoarthrinium moseri]|nr:hypothetical protein JX266_009327 [Neoarthrinium moseri]